ncbi:hypothetical protein DSM106972_058710 [Dulcicalothrix desertica PCC 7102]|uniref:Uncharacterized protein n=1 Tax=Dulcicalothrix desertica PCC 7102 TaxID=232991 RepID=A0A3S1ITZ5_9CYAN|nr:hypothetical protein [Dulcicalothrix desertica]RUT02393.1 hypothetical protein DSM106972_058710 [Dulcicalothrix desertica PCC 7102]TWH55388.1 hypothetical protein CAL7102_03517 [Dulcicalothrix desertica PCC 7102]
MVKYSFYLKVKVSGDEHSYSLDLNSNQENAPEKVFTSEVRENIRLNLQNQSLCAIKDNHINQIVNTWIQDIKEGYRDSTLTLNLPLLIESGIEELNEQGNQEIPALVNPDLSDIEPTFGMLPPLIFS